MVRTTGVAYGGPRELVTAADADHQQHRRRDEQHRQDHVQRHDPGVEIGQHRDAADDALEGDAERDERGESAQLAGRAGPAPHRDEGGDHDSDQDIGQHAVAELDDAVHAERTMRHERAVGAPWPRRAAEAGAGQAYETAGQHDHDVGDDRRPGPTLHVGAFRCPKACCHSHLKVLETPRPQVTAHTNNTTIAKAPGPWPAKVSRSPWPKAPDGNSCRTWRAASG